MNDDVLIKAENVGKKFCRNLKKSLMYGAQDIGYDLLGKDRSHAGLRRDEFWANEGISFELKRGECLGLIGKNGAGKTTLLKMLNGLIKPDRGLIEMHGRVGALIALGAGFNPILTGRENIYINGSVLGLSKKEIGSKIDDIINFAEIEEFIDTPVQNYSSGMQVRLGFAIATTLNPDILILDEVLAVGDAEFRSKCYSRILEMRKKAAVIFVTHTMEQLGRICDYSMLLEKGKSKYYGEVSGGIELYENYNEGSDKNDGSFNKVKIPLTNFSIEIENKEVISNEKLKFLLHIDSMEKIENFTLRMIFYNKNGNLAADLNCDSKNKNKTIIENNQVWTMAIQSIPLKQGKYKIGFNIIDSKGDLLVWSYKETYIIVKESHKSGISDCQLVISEWSVDE